ncbi:hypothetical protein [Caballeronia zhejiangensis]|nr:hypothetical protein [Caballeronia zhejiangensis]MCI1042239.1 hypothetical protein [Caballeronia zhejiangensis]
MRDFSVLLSSLGFGSLMEAVLGVGLLFVALYVIVCHVLTVVAAIRKL